MDGLTETTATQLQTGTAHDFPSLFVAYIDFVDRSEKTAQTYAKNLRQFAAWMYRKGIEAPTRDDIIAYRDYLLQEHEAIIYDPVSGWKPRTDRNGGPLLITCKANTVSQYIRSIAAFFRWTAESGIYPNVAAGIHSPKIRHDTHRKEALTPAEVLNVEKSIDAAAAAQAEKADQAAKDSAGRVQRSEEQSKRLKAIYLLAVNCGLRTVELSRANISDIEVKGGQAYIYIWGKGHSEPDTRKPIPPAIKTAIDDYIQSRKDKPTGKSPLFVSTGNRSGGQRIAPTTISMMLKKAMKAAGYDSTRITAHSLRHTAGTNVMKLTGDLYLTQKYMRHSNPGTTEIYLHNETEDREAEVAQQLYDLYHNAT